MYNSNHADVAFNEKNGILNVTLKSSIKNDDHLKGELTQMLDAVKKNNIKKILIENSDLGHTITAGLQSWAHENIEFPLLQAGVDKIAIVKPAGSNAFSSTSHVDHARKRYFPSEDSAMAWLGE